MKILLMKLEIEENIVEMLDYNEVNQYSDYKLEMLDYKNKIIREQNLFFRTNL